MKKLYIVRATVTTYCSLAVAANSEEEAIEIAEKTDGGDFETDDISGDFKILEAIEQEDQIDENEDLIKTVAEQMRSNVDYTEDVQDITERHGSIEEYFRKFPSELMEWKDWFDGK